MHPIRLAFALVATVAVVSCSDPTAPQESQSVPLTDQSSANRKDGKLFFPFVFSSTLTVFNVQSVTSTVPLTCFRSASFPLQRPPAARRSSVTLSPPAALNGSTTACTGRRRRRRNARLARPRELEAPPLSAGSAPELRPSVSEDRGNTANPEASRLVLTSWITVVSSLTSVSTVTTFGTTVSLDLLCSIGGTTFLPFCGGK